ncbi:MAG: ankyrin repeat domain-containing protein [Vicinamibacterales bacterium]
MIGNRLMRGVRATIIGALSLSTLLYAASDSSSVADSAQAGNTEAVIASLKHSADVNAPQGDGMTALHWAAAHNNADLVAVLLHAGANVKATTRMGAYTPLILAARNGSPTAIVPLVKAGADVNARTSNGATSLMFAAGSGDVESVTALLDHGAEVNAIESARGLSAMMFAAAANRSGVIKVLADHGADLKATTKIIDLRNLDRSAFAGVLNGNPSPPPSPDGRGGRGRGGNAMGAPAGRGSQPKTAGFDRDYQGNELVYAQGGMTPLMFAARQGFLEATTTLLDVGADVNQLSAGDQTSPLLEAVINGNFDVAKILLDRGADPKRASKNGATPLYAVLNVEWAPRSVRPQPRAQLNQKLSYLDMMQLLLDKGADPNARLTTRVWYSGNLSGVDEIGATPFWRAAYASDVDAMRLLVARGADPNIATIKGAGRPRADTMMMNDEREYKETSPLPPVPTGGSGVPAIVAAAGVGYGEGFAGNTHHYAPSGMLVAVKYLVEELHMDVNMTDHEGNTALHDAAARGDIEMIQYLVSKGANVMAVNREGKTTADMANGPTQRIQPWPEALALLEKLGAKNNHKCVSC